MDFTSRLQLKKPAVGDKALASDFAENFDKLDAQAAGPLNGTSISRPGAPYIGQKIWETDTKQERMWNGTRWMWLNGTRPHAKAVHDNGAQAALSTNQGATTAISAYPVEVEGGFTTSGTPGSTVTPLDLIIPEDGLYEVNLTAWQSGGATGVYWLCVFVPGVNKQWDALAIMRTAAVDYFDNAKFNQRFTAGQAVRMAAYRASGDATGAFTGITLANSQSASNTSLELTYLGA